MVKMFEESSYVGYDGTQMYMCAWLPETEPLRSILILIHGLGSHGQTLKNIGEYFAKLGFAVFAPDMRGFGHYSGRKGHVMNFDEYIEDMHNIVKQVRARTPERTLFLFGHSLGGLHVIRYVATYPHAVDGIILSCPAVSQRLPIHPLTRISARFLSLLNVKIYFKNRVDFAFASHDPAVQREHENDPLRFDCVTPRFGASALSAAENAMQLAPLITIPTLVQQAGDDRMVIPEKSRQFYEKINTKDKEWILYEGLYHELHGEIEKDRVLADMARWLERRLPR